jgi:hypothetical protein
MKKIAGPEQQAIVDLKLRAIQESVNGHIAKMNNLLKQPQPNLKEILMELNNNAAAMSKVVSQKTLELKSMIIAPPPVTTTAPAPAAPADDQNAKDKHLGPRGKKQNPKLPDFWRRNFDYGESPYMHMDEIKTITDRPISKRKRKKKK